MAPRRSGLPEDRVHQAGFDLKTVLWGTASNVLLAREGNAVPGRLSRIMRPGTMSIRATTALRLPEGVRPS